MIRYPITKILNFNETFYFLFYDLIQLVLLLLLTGGLTNPFCVLILAPIVIAATYLDLKRTFIIVSICWHEFKLPRLPGCKKIKFFLGWFSILDNILSGDAKRN